MTDTSVERRFMLRALRLARRGLGSVSPNPPVGAVIVRDGEVLAEGCHRRHGGPHAEADALERSGDLDLRGADIYVTLEPCGHHGKTPPCADAIRASGLGRVIYAVDDPNPRTRGVGPARLRDAGIVVESGLCEKEAREFLAPYLVWTLSGRPLVTAKWAMTADGRIAAASGDARWISSDATRRRTRRERSLHDAILVGRGTAAKDDPLLTSDVSGRRDPLRVVLDTQLRLPLGSQLVRTAGEVPLLVATLENPPEDRAAALGARGVELLALPGRPGRVDLEALLVCLGERGVQHLLVEGGGEVHGQFFDEGRIDRVQVIVSPKVVGGREALAPVGGVGAPSMAAAVALEEPRWRRSDGDLILSGSLTATGRGDWTPPDRG